MKGYYNILFYVRDEEIIILPTRVVRTRIFLKIHGYYGLLIGRVIIGILNYTFKPNLYFDQKNQIPKVDLFVLAL